MNLPPEVRAIVRTRFAEETATAYLEMTRPSIGYAPADEGWSAFGGDPSVAAFPWPAYQGVPMLMLAQIDCAEAAELLGDAWPFTADGRLLFFHDDDFAAPYSGAEGDEACRVMHVAGSPVAPLPAGRRTIPPLPLVPAPLAALPSWQNDADKALGVGVLDMIDLWEDLSPLLPAPRHRLLGYPDKQGPEVTGHRPLLQVEAEEGTAWGEIVSVTFWITDADLRAGILTNVRRSYQVA
ncbi:DUF1963 domain-containing protein [Actinoplanes regularis]|uniref:Uncharacterized protein YwqG n=1 Tax=Actinoplanes regularis TaxID=52697 RepID=A0A238ZJB2_9ACTN|nr:DUF1963 domain-containing protein [Actinoplanes regularis]GIE87658.1 hypothetical protein Are01nite_41380 [Actinoplanes regularis]SNR83242.1 Uncharacterized protein YwqG [Actinoplanes regularis]